MDDKWRDILDGAEQDQCREAALAAFRGEPLPNGWWMITGVELHEAKLHNEQAMARWAGKEVPNECIEELE